MTGLKFLEAIGAIRELNKLDDIGSLERRLARLEKRGDKIGIVIDEAVDGIAKVIRSTVKYLLDTQRDEKIEELEEEMSKYRGHRSPPNPPPPV
jgi:hypothetical protein